MTPRVHDERLTCCMHFRKKLLDFSLQLTFSGFNKLILACFLSKPYLDAVWQQANSIRLIDDIKLVLLVSL